MENLGTHVLFIKIICSHPKSRETIPIIDWCKSVIPLEHVVATVSHFLPFQRLAERAKSTKTECWFGPLDTIPIRIGF